MKKIISLNIILIVMIIFTVGVIKFSPVVIAGYNMYKEATNHVSISAKADEIKNKENYIKLDEISDLYKDKLLKSEDKRFYYHFGMDPIATMRAAANNLLEGRYAQGGSTITQQLAKNMYFSFEKKFERKVAELFVAFQLENDFTKDEILELYCNITYFGEGCYGLKEAAMHYYGSTPAKLTDSQIDALVWTLKSPNNYNPNKYKNIAKVENFKMQLAVN